MLKLKYFPDTQIYIYIYIYIYSKKGSKSDNIEKFIYNVIQGIEEFNVRESQLTL